MSIKRTIIIDDEDIQAPSKEINEINIAVDLTEATLKHTIEAEYNRIYRELNELNLFKNTLGLENVTLENSTKAVEMDIFEIYKILNSMRENLKKLEKLLAKYRPNEEDNEGDNK